MVASPGGEQRHDGERHRHGENCSVAFKSASFRYFGHIPSGMYVAAIVRQFTRAIRPVSRQANGAEVCKGAPDCAKKATASELACKLGHSEMTTLRILPAQFVARAAWPGHFVIAEGQAAAFA